ncbi:MAG: potassium transporter KtrB [Trueperaceae bacterium]|nr:potassium transporter KtrB [Trueperaceae bacterium]
MSAPRVAVASFLAAILVGTLLLSSPASGADGQRLALIDALFMATSALCITGLAVIEAGVDLSALGQAVLLTLIKVGGFGVVTLGVLIALATGRRIGFRERMSYSLAHNPSQFGGIVRLLRNVFLFMTVMELLGAGLLWLRLDAAHVENPAFVALFHGISAFNHAGLSTFPGSLERFATDPVIVLTVAALIAVASLGTVVVFELVGMARFRGPRRPRLTLHSRLALMATGSLIVGGAILMAVMEWSNPATLGEMSTLDRITSSLFQAVTPRSAGFNTVDYGEMRQGTQLLTMLLMFVGGSPGSVAGGIKTTTFVILLASIWQISRGSRELNLFGRRVETALIMKSAAICTSGVLLVGGSATLLSFTDPDKGLTEIVFEVISAVSTVGLSLGITGELSEPGKLVVAALMFVGRIGLLTFLLAFVQKKNRPSVRYPREDVLVG